MKKVIINSQEINDIFDVQVRDISNEINKSVKFNGIEGNNLVQICTDVISNIKDINIDQSENLNVQIYNNDQLEFEFNGKAQFLGYQCYINEDSYRIHIVCNIIGN